MADCRLSVWFQKSFADHDPKEAPANFLGTPVLRQAQSAASLLRLGLANSKNSARSPWYLAPGRLTCHPLMMAFPDESTTRHSHLDRPRPLSTTTSSINRIGRTSSYKVQSHGAFTSTLMEVCRRRLALRQPNENAQARRCGPFE
jgi:hypothetical protein